MRHQPDRDDILEVMAETITELSSAIEAKPKSRSDREKSEFGQGFRIYVIEAKSP